MKTEYQWKSTLAPWIKGFLEELNMTGYSGVREERHLRHFDQFFFVHSSSSILEKQDVEAFCNGFAHESVTTKVDKTNTLRKFALYLNRLGEDAYVHPKVEHTQRKNTFVPYIFSESELRKLFSMIDQWDELPNCGSNRKIVDPVLFRMLYGCGLRIGEALKLRVCDVDLEEGTLRIIQGKNKKDRIIPMAKTLIQRCREYNTIVHVFSSDDAIYFPGRYNGRYNISSIYYRFRQYLWKAGISHIGKCKGPRLHDFRHSFCVHRLKKWVLAGKDISNLIPYLSAYLGHADFRGTQYYLRLTADLYPDIINRMEVAYAYIIPEKEHNHEPHCQ